MLSCDSGTGVDEANGNVWVGIDEFTCGADVEEANGNSDTEEVEEVFVMGMMGQNENGEKPKGCRTEIDVGDKGRLLLLLLL